MLLAGTVVSEFFLPDQPAIFTVGNLWIGFYLFIARSIFEVSSTIDTRVAGGLRLLAAYGALTTFALEL